MLVKFWFHISKKEQRRRLERMQEDRAERWKVQKEDLQRNRRYGEWLEAVEEMLSRTDTPACPWTVVEATDQRWTRVKVFETLVARMEEALARRSRRPEAVSRTHLAQAALHDQRARRKAEERARARRSPRTPGCPSKEGSAMSRLDAVDLGRRLARKDYERTMAAEQLRMRDLHFRMYERQVPVLAVFEGWDAAGKGGAIKRVTATLEPRGFTVSSFSVPRGEEKTHHYLWRSGGASPARGISGSSTARSTEGARGARGGVLLGGRVEASLREINEFEAHQASIGMVIRKFWLHVSPEDGCAASATASAIRSAPTSSRRRTGGTGALEGIRGRGRGDARAHVHASAPWTVVEADDKLYARVKVLKTVADAVEKALGQ